MTRTQAAWYQVSNIEELDSPALIVYPDRIKENIRLLTTMIDSVQRLRPHAKTHKTKEVALLMMEAGIQKFKCATIAEAEMLGLAGAPDVLLAYQPLGPKLQRFITLIKKYPGTHFSCLIDHAAAAHQQSQAFAANHLTVPVYIDLNVGQNRTGIAPGQPAIDLYETCMSLPGIQVAGFQAYDGHIHGKDLKTRTAATQAAYAPVEELQAALLKKGYPAPVIIAGGSPTFPVHALRPAVECSPGTFVFWDKGYSDECAEQPFHPAAVLVTRIISLPDATKLCLDLGHKSVASENELSRRVYFLNAPDLKPVGHSEEHLVVEAGPGHSWKIGDVLYGLPIHICPTVALYERLITIEDGKTSGEWKVIARDRKINF